MSIFHSISAFCNAGFDILGTADNTFVSLSGYAGNFWLNIVIMLLIIIGGIGFLTWDDVYTNKLRFKRYRMQSKIILLTTAILIFVPAIFFFVCDFGQVSIGKRTLLSLFQSVTTRTAGFNTADLSSMTEVGTGDHDTSYANGRITKFYSRWHENNDSGSPAFECVCDISKS